MIQVIRIYANIWHKKPILLYGYISSLVVCPHSAGRSLTDFVKFRVSCLRVISRKLWAWESMRNRLYIFKETLKQFRIGGRGPFRGLKCCVFGQWPLCQDRVRILHPKYNRGPQFSQSLIIWWAHMVIVTSPLSTLTLLREWLQVLHYLGIGLWCW